MKKLNDFEDYGLAIQKLVDLKTQLHALEADSEAVLANINTAKNEKSSDPIQVQARALISGTDASVIDVTNLRTVHGQLCQKVKIHQAAVRLQEHVVEKLRLKYSSEICKAAEKEYLSLLKKSIASAVQCAKDFTNAKNFINNLHDDGVIVELPDMPIHLHRLGTWNDPHSHVHAMLDDATKAGIVNGEYKDHRPQIDHEPWVPDTGIKRLAAGPDGVREVTVLPGQQLKTDKWLYQPGKK